MQRQSQIQDERTRIMKKLNKEYQQAHLQEMQVKQERHKKDFMYNAVTDEEMLRRDMMSYNEQERLKKARKVEQQ